MGYAAYTYDEAVQFLAKGRDKRDRPLRHNRRMRWLGAGIVGQDSIALRLHATNCVVLHPDGTQTINTGGWNTMTTRGFLDEFSAANVSSVSYQLFVHHCTDEISSAKWQKCRTRGCRGTGKVTDTCYGPGYCYGYSDYPCEHGERTTHPREHCHHGEPAAHKYVHECYGCGGTGQRDYGSKRQAFAWDGGWLRITADGIVVGPEIITDAYLRGSSDSKEPVILSASTVVNMPTVQNTLESLVPGMNDRVKCPKCSIVNPVSAAVIHLNDLHKLTREEIADWLETLDVDLAFRAAS